MLRFNPGSKHLLYCGHWLVRAAGHVGVWVLQLSVASQNREKLAGKYAQVDSNYDGVCRGGGRHGHKAS